MKILLLAFSYLQGQPPCLRLYTLKLERNPHAWRRHGSSQHMSGEKAAHTDLPNSPGVLGLQSHHKATSDAVHLTFVMAISSYHTLNFLHLTPTIPKVWDTYLIFIASTF